ncbi:DUF4407 domain-containing protein [Planotetraspora sp. GP83]|uniref:DUF4407 domain-containing protein n=1 Tax=Planotetraspora sp. GP83 TaxID=3156264 RepID=UPI0035145B88
MIAAYSSPAASVCGQEIHPRTVRTARSTGDLTFSNLTVFFAHFMLAGLLIVIDCFPVLTKLISGPSVYDRRHAAQVRSKKQLHEHDLRLTERLKKGEADMRIHQEDLRVQRSNRQYPGIKIF